MSKYLTLILCLISLFNALSQSTLGEFKELSLEKRENLLSITKTTDSNYIGLVSKMDWSEGLVYELKIIYLTNELTHVDSMNLLEELGTEKLNILDSKIIDNQLIIIYRHLEKSNSSLELIYCRIDLSKKSISEKKVFKRFKSSRSIFQVHISAGLSENGRFFFIEYDSIINQPSKKLVLPTGNAKIDTYSVPNVNLVSTHTVDSLTWMDLDHRITPEINDDGEYMSVLMNRVDERISISKVSRDLNITFYPNLPNFSGMHLFKGIEKSIKIGLLSEVAQNGFKFSILDLDIENTSITFIGSYNYYIDPTKLKLLTYSEKKKDSVDFSIDLFDFFETKNSYVVRYAEKIERLEEVNQPTIRGRQSVRYFGNLHFIYLDKNDRTVSEISTINFNRYAVEGYLPKMFQMKETKKNNQVSLIQNSDAFKEFYNKDLNEVFGYENNHQIDILLTNVSNDDQPIVVKTGGEQITHALLNYNDAMMVSKNEVVVEIVGYNNNATERDKRAYRRFIIIKTR